MMYTITRGPSKLVTQRRTGPTQQIESKVNDLKLRPTSWLTSNSPPPKLVFNRLNGKRYHTASTQKADGPAEGFTPAHQENVRFVYEAWQEVEQKMEDGEAGGGEPLCVQGPVQYAEKTPSGGEPQCVQGPVQYAEKTPSGGEPQCVQGPVQYAEKTPSPVMKNFVPIDLEEWWAQRFLANIGNLS